MMEDDRRLPEEVESLVNHSTDILKKLNYKNMRPRLADEEFHIDFFKPLQPNSYYPRFHMILAIPITNPLITINSFHVDKTKHNSPITFLRQTMEKKDQEVKELLKQLGEMEQSIARDQLIELLQSEQLYGNIRETNVQGRKRLFGQIRVERRRKLRKGTKHRWEERKNQILPDEEEGVD